MSLTKKFYMNDLLKSLPSEEYLVQFSYSLIKALKFSWLSTCQVDCWS